MANAGAIPPMICRDREILRPRVEGVPLGLLPDREYEEISFQSQPGDLIVLYSDGIPDHLSPSGEEYGRARLSEVIKSGCNLTAQEVVDSIFSNLDRFNREPFDDQTLVVMKVK